MRFFGRKQTRPTLGEVTRNVVITARLVAEHLHDDPVLLLFQTTRRVPRRFVRPAAAAVKRVATATGNRGGKAYAAWALGNEAEARALVTEPLGTRPAGRRWLGEIALQLGLVAVAEKYADELAETSPAARGLVSRLHWHRGEMTDAVNALSSSSRREARTKRRLESEIETMRPGWIPRIEQARLKPTGASRPQTETRDESLTALHQLTNSVPHTFSGYTMRSRAILESQRAAGIRASAVTRIGYPVAIGAPLAKTVDTVGGIDYRRLLPTRMAGTPAGRLTQQAELIGRLVDDVRPDVLHTTTHFTNALVARSVATSRGLPWVYEVRGLLEDTWAAGRADPEAATRSERYRAFRAKETECMLAADLVVTLGTPMRDLLIERGVKPENTLVAPNAVDGELLELDDVEPADARARLGLPREGLWVGTVSSLVDYEGLDTLVDAVAALRSAGRDVRLLIVGDGVSRNALEERARRSGLGADAVFTGRVPKSQTPDYYRALDIFCVPRRDLSVCRLVSPLKPVEAMGLRRPLVVSDLPALAELTADGTAGVTADPDDADAFAAAIAGLDDSPGRRHAMGETGRDYVRAERTWAQNAEKYRAAYAALCAKRPEAAR